MANGSRESHVNLTLQDGPVSLEGGPGIQKKPGDSDSIIVRTPCTRLKLCFTVGRSLHSVSQNEARYNRQTPET